MVLSTTAPAADSTVQRPFLAGVQAAFDAVDAKHDGKLELLQSAVSRYAVRTEAAMKADIQRVTIGSIVGLTLLLLVLLRSLRLVLLVLPVLAAGFLTGTTVCLLLFGSLHGLTLAFGAALIGVSIDYAVHFHCHESLAPHPDGPRATLSSIWSGLLLGAATTVVGFIALIVSSFPGLRELAVFAASGITASLFATRLFLPGLAVRAEPSRLGRAVARSIGAGVSITGRRRAMLAVPAVIIGILIPIGLPLARWNDVITDLSRIDPALLAEDNEVRSSVIRYEQRRLVIATGVDEEAALVANDRVAAALEAAAANGEIEGSRSLATLVPSATRQRAVDRALREDAGLWDRLATAFAAEGLVATAFTPFREALAAPPPEPLRLADLTGTTLEPLVRPFKIRLEEGIGIVSFLQGLQDPAALRRRLDGIEGAWLLDVEAVITSAYATYRQRMTTLLLFGLLAIIGLVALRHRAVRPTIAACLPALLAAGGTIAILAICGIPLNMLSLVALLMVVSMGVDYGVFLAEKKSSSAALDATHLAVLVAGVSTILGFGLLSLSEQPALYSIGLTSGIGVSLCLVLAPTLRALAVGSVEKRP